MKSPTIWKLKNLLESASSNSRKVASLWVPARPYGYPGWPNRIRAAWLVFTGKADAVIWPEDQ